MEDIVGITPIEKEKEELKEEKKSDSIGYKGNVSIKYVNRKGNIVKESKKHNTGTISLFRLLANSIIGINESRSMPNFIHTYNWNEVDSNKFTNSTCTTNIVFSKKSVSLVAGTSEDTTVEDSYASVEFQFLIPYTQLYGITNVLALYGSTAFNEGDNSSYDVLAYVVLDSEDEIDMTIDDRLNVLVTWTMTVQNL